MERNSPYNFDTSLVSKTKFHFQALLFFLGILCLLNIFYKVDFTQITPVIRLNLWNPTWLLLGPAIYFITLLIRFKPIRTLSAILHHIPFLVFLAYFLYIYQTVDLRNPWLSPDFRRYQNTFIVIPLSLFTYSILSLSQFTTISATAFPGTKSLILSIIGQFILASIVHSMTFVAWGITHVDLLIDYRFFNYGLLALIFLSIARYLIKNFKKSGKPGMADPPVPDTTFAVQAARVEKYFNNSKIYLNPDLNLEVISNDLSIPKHVISCIFKEHFKTNFYMHVANLRIAYAITLMTDNPFLSIESVAVSSGFNSKSSFNKYFKAIMNKPPSEYLELIKIKEQEAY